MAAAYFAPKVPQQIVTQIDASVLAWFDDNLEPSQLRQKTKTEVTALANALPTQENITIHIYHSEFLGANAFALPGGSIILTDKLVTTLQQDELLAVLLHEVGHIEAKHSMEGLLHGAG